MSKINYSKKILTGFSLLFFFQVLLTPASQAQQRREIFITSLEWSGEYWLIEGFYSSKEKGVGQFLVKCDDKDFLTFLRSSDLEHQN